MTSGVLEGIFLHYPLPRTARRQRHHQVESSFVGCGKHYFSYIVSKLFLFTVFCNIIWLKWNNSLCWFNYIKGNNTSNINVGFIKYLFFKISGSCRFICVWYEHNGRRKYGARVNPPCWRVRCILHQGVRDVFIKLHHPLSFTVYNVYMCTSINVIFHYPSQPSMYTCVHP